MPCGRSCLTSPTISNWVAQTFGFLLTMSTKTGPFQQRRFRPQRRNQNQASGQGLPNVLDRWHLPPPPVPAIVGPSSVSCKQDAEDSQGSRLRPLHLSPPFVPVGSSGYSPMRPLHLNPSKNNLGGPQQSVQGQSHLSLLFGGKVGPLVAPKITLDRFPVCLDKGPRCS